MPQWDFLDFLAQEARHYPTFSLRMEAEAAELLCRRRAAWRASGSGRRGDAGAADHCRRRAHARSCETKQSSRAKTSARRSTCSGSGFPRRRRPANETGGTFGAGAMIVEIDRGDYWQCAYVVPKGAAERDRGQGIDAFRKDVAQAAPELAPVVDTLKDMGSGEAALRIARPADPLVASRTARHRRRGARHVAGRRRRDQPCGPGRGCRREHSRRTARARGETSIRC